MPVQTSSRGTFGEVVLCAEFSLPLVDSHARLARPVALALLVASPACVSLASCCCAFLTDDVARRGVCILFAVVVDAVAARPFALFSEEPFAVQSAQPYCVLQNCFPKISAKAARRIGAQFKFCAPAACKNVPI